MHLGTLLRATINQQIRLLRKSSMTLLKQAESSSWGTWPVFCMTSSLALQFRVLWTANASTRNNWSWSPYTINTSWDSGVAWHFSIPTVIPFRRWTSRSLFCMKKFMWNSQWNLHHALPVWPCITCHHKTISRCVIEKIPWFLEITCFDSKYWKEALGWEYFPISCVSMTLCSVEYDMLKSSCACYLQLPANIQDHRGWNDVKEVTGPKIDEL